MALSNHLFWPPLIPAAALWRCASTEDRRSGSSLARLGRVYGSSEITIRDEESDSRVSLFFDDDAIRRSRFWDHQPCEWEESGRLLTVVHVSRSSPDKTPTGDAFSPFFCRALASSTAALNRLSISASSSGRGCSPESEGANTSTE